MMPPSIPGVPELIAERAASAAQDEELADLVCVGVVGGLTAAANQDEAGHPAVHSDHECVTVGFGP